MPLAVPANMIEFAGAKLWRHDNPESSVFDCSSETQEIYRARVRIVVCALGMELME